MLIANALTEFENRRLKSYIAGRMASLYVQLNDPSNRMSVRLIRSDIEALSRLYDSL